MKMACASCGWFIKSGMNNAVDKNCPLFEAGLNQCDLIEEGSAIFCNICLATIAASKPPSFGHMNAVNTTCFHQFPMVLSDLTLVEEAIIARAHLMILILKLLPADRASPQSIYKGIRGHAVILPQNPGPFVNMLPSSTFQVQDIIRVVWASDKTYTEDQLRLVITVRKHE